MKKIELEKVIPDNESSFKAAVFKNAYFTSPLHFHPEYEIVLIEEGDGLCFCGDYIGNFAPGDIAVFGKGIPHFYLSDNRFYEENSLEKCKSVYIQFREELLPKDYIQMPAFKMIHYLLSKAQRGVYFPQKGDSTVADFIRSMPYLIGFEKLMSLYNILNQLAEINDFKVLASYSYQNNDISSHPVYHRVISYISQNYCRQITLDELAATVQMNRSALCRRFRIITGKTIFEFLNEFRIAYACKLIANTDDQISAIAYSCGFNNMSHFNSVFKSMTNYSPTTYRGMFTKK